MNCIATIGILLLTTLAAYAGNGLPLPTTTQVLDGQMFDYNETNNDLILGTRAIIFGSNSNVVAPPSGTRSSFYIHLDTDTPFSGNARYGAGTNVPPYNIGWWQANYPQCVVYGSDTKTPSWEFGESADGGDAPVAIWNSTCQNVLLTGSSGYVAKVVGYDFIAIDNGFVLNNGATPIRSGTCTVIPDTTGCTHAGGTWTQRYSSSSDPQFATDVTAWLGVIASDLHPNTLLMLNIGGTPAASLSTVAGYVAAGVDMPLDEISWWNACAPPWSASDWATRVAFYWHSGSPYNLLDNNNLTDLVYPVGGGSPTCAGHNAVSQEELDFVLASDMLVKGSHTYLSTTAYLGYGSYEPFPGPWRFLNHGAPDGAYSVSGGVYSRTFNSQNVIVAVNTNSTATAFTLPSGTYHRLNGATASGSVVLPPYPAGSSGSMPAGQVPGAIVLVKGISPGIFLAH